MKLTYVCNEIYIREVITTYQRGSKNNCKLNLFNHYDQKSSSFSIIATQREGKFSISHLKKSVVFCFTEKRDNS